MSRREQYRIDSSAKERNNGMKVLRFFVVGIVFSPVIFYTFETLLGVDGFKSIVRLLFFSFVIIFVFFSVVNWASGKETGKRVPRSNFKIIGFNGVYSSGYPRIGKPPAPPHYESVNIMDSNRRIEVFDTLAIIDKGALYLDEFGDVAINDEKLTELFYDEV